MLQARFQAHSCPSGLASMINAGGSSVAPISSPRRRPFICATRFRAAPSLSAMLTLTSRRQILQD